MICLDSSKIEVSTHPQGYKLFRIKRDDLAPMGITDDVLALCFYGQGSRTHVVMFAHRLIAMVKLKRLLPHDAIVKFRDNNKSNVACENLQIFRLVEVE